MPARPQHARARFAALASPLAEYCGVTPQVIGQVSIFNPKGSRHIQHTGAKSRTSFALRNYDSALEAVWSIPIVSTKCV
jgi:hypothetical protein